MKYCPASNCLLLWYEAKNIHWNSRKTHQLWLILAFKMILKSCIFTSVFRNHMTCWLCFLFCCISFISSSLKQVTCNYKSNLNFCIRHCSSFTLWHCVKGQLILSLGRHKSHCPRLVSSTIDYPIDQPAL